MTISRTAANMAAFRALETVKPADQRLFADPYARLFLSPRERLALAGARSGLVRRLIELYADRRAPGARTSGIARTRLIDDWLAAECGAGAAQVVFLGAGYDCRALRLPALSSARVFELDRPALLARKESLLGTPPAHLMRVAIDFQRDAIAARLLTAGYEPDARSVFVWEGVTNYLDDASVGAVLDTIAGFKARLIFTYVHADAVAGTFDAKGLGPLLKELRRIGEPWTFGLRPEVLGDYLNRHGLRPLADLGAEDYRALYWDAAKAGQGYEYYRVALAEPDSP